MYSGKEEKYYCGMDAKSLLKLDDKKLIWAIWVREDSTGMGSLEEVSWDPHMVFGVVYRFYFSVIEHPNLELDEIGMRFYFGSYLREENVPYLSECFDIIGAKDYKDLFDEFICENNIDVHDLSKYAKTIQNDYDGQAKVYRFEKIDEKFRKLTGIESCLAQYVRKNMRSFVEESDFNMFKNLSGSIIEALEKVLHLN